MRNKTTTEASLEVASKIEAAGVVPADPILKSPRAIMNATAGAVTDVQDRAEGLVFKVLVSQTITFSKEYEVRVDDDDKVTYKEVQ